MRIQISATETILYSKAYELDELLEYLNDGLPPLEQITFADLDNDVDRLTEAVMNKAHSYDARTPGFAEDLERNGAVEGQTWRGLIIP